MMSPDLSTRMAFALASSGARDELNMLLGGSSPFGRLFVVDTVNGNDNNDGRSFEGAKQTMAAALAAVDSRDVIYAVGDIREQDLYAPLGVYDVQIIGANRGRPRHSTSGGTVVDGNGTSWREASTAANAPLIKLREQGWGIHNITMIPESGYSAVQLRCAEDATDPDASHFVASGVFFVSSGTRVGYALEDIGGANHVGIYGCEFRLLEYAWKQTSVGIRSPQWHQWFDNIFTGNKNDVALNALACEFRRNRFRTVYDATTHPITLDLADTADAGVAATANFVVDNEFADAAANVTIAKGYVPGTGDVWRNRVSDTAADIVTVPA